MAVPAILKIDSRDSCLIGTALFARSAECLHKSTCLAHEAGTSSCEVFLVIEIFVSRTSQNFLTDPFALSGSALFRARKRVQPKVHLSGCRRQVTRFVHHLVLPMVKPSRCQEDALFFLRGECLSCSRSPVKKNCRSAIHCRRPTRRHTRKQQKRSASGIRCGM